MKKLLLLTPFILLVSCTDNTIAKKWGGTVNVDLEPNRKLVNITWKDESLWILTKDSKLNDTPETYEFKEHSSYGIVEGRVVITETKKTNIADTHIRKNYDTKTKMNVFNVNN